MVAVPEVLPVLPVLPGAAGGSGCRGSGAGGGVLPSLGVILIRESSNDSREARNRAKRPENSLYI